MWAIWRRLALQEPDGSNGETAASEAIETLATSKTATTTTATSFRLYDRVQLKKTEAAKSTLHNRLKTEEKSSRFLLSLTRSSSSSSGQRRGDAMSPLPCPGLQSQSGQQESPFPPLFVGW